MRPRFASLAALSAPPVGRRFPRWRSFLQWTQAPPPPAAPRPARPAWMVLDLVLAANPSTAAVPDEGELFGGDGYSLPTYPARLRVDGRRPDNLPQLS